jgi:hypothetical protein
VRQRTASVPMHSPAHPNPIADDDSALCLLLICYIADRLSFMDRLKRCCKCQHQLHRLAAGPAVDYLAARQ